MKVLRGGLRRLNGDSIVMIPFFLQAVCVGWWSRCMPRCNDLLTFIACCLFEIPTI